MVIVSVGCSAVLFTTSAAIAARVWGTLPPAERGVGVLFVPAFGGSLDMSVVTGLSMRGLGVFIACFKAEGCVFKTISYF